MGGEGELIYPNVKLKTIREHKVLLYECCCRYIDQSLHIFTAHKSYEHHQ